MRSAIPIDELREKFAYNPETGVVTKIGGRGSAATGFQTSRGYITFSANGRTMFAHRIAWALTHGVWPECLDHINHCRSDNRLLNLRTATHVENYRNLLARAGKEIPYKGVCVKDGSFQARITVFYRRHVLGYWKDPISAALAYDRAAKYFHGDFAATNYSLGLIPAALAAQPRSTT